MTNLWTKTIRKKLERRNQYFSQKWIQKTTLIKLCILQRSLDDLNNICGRHFYIFQKKSFLAKGHIIN